MFQLSDRSITFKEEGRDPLVVADGLRVTANVNGETITLGARTAGIDDSVRLIAADESVEANVRLVDFGSTAAVFVSAEIRNRTHHDKQKAFDAERGIVLTFEQFPGLTRLMANYQHKDWWTRPYFQTDIHSLPDRTLSLLWQKEQTYYHLLPVSSGKLRNDLRGTEHGVDVQLSAHRAGHTRIETLAFVIGTGTNPFLLAEHTAGLGMAQRSGGGVTRRDKQYPEILDYLGWCSWDAFYQEVNAEGLRQKATELRDTGLPFRWMLIDDGWSAVNDGKLTTFEADPQKFPDGLAAAVDEIKREAGVDWVGVWHTIAGYWGGIDPEGAAFDETREWLYETANGKWLPYPGTQGFGFWNAWHGWLRRQGIDFVKVDSQSALLNFFKHGLAIGEVAEAMHQALEASVFMHFNGNLVNCMGMAPENIWNRPASSVSRSSDDFMPQQKESFPEHAMQNAYNDVYHGAFYWGDWDMYWSEHADSKLGMILRSVSGGPVYVSDALGKTNPEMIWPLVYRSGKLVRCDRPGVPTEDMLFRDPTEHPYPLKIWNTAGRAGVVAAFHLNQNDDVLEGETGPQDIPGLDEAERYLIFEPLTGHASIVDAGSKKSFRLSAREAALFLIIPLQDGVTPIGLTDKLISSDAVIRVSRTAGSCYVRLKEGGPFVFHSEKVPDKVTVDHMEVPFEKLSTDLFRIDAGGSAEETEVAIHYQA